MLTHFIFHYKSLLPENETLFSSKMIFYAIVSNKKGIFDATTAKSFKDNVLSQGGTFAPIELYKRFRCQEPKVDALLKRAGLL